MANVLVTGGAGFIGSNLVEQLIKDNHQVTVWDNFSSGKINNPRSTVFDIDISKDNFEKIISNDKFEIIYHLAADSRVQTSINNPIQAINSNIVGTGRILDLALRQGSKVVYAGSSTATNQYNSPYAFTKFAGEECCRMYSKVYGLSVAVARFFNVYGPNHLAEGSHATVMAIFEKQKREGKKITITGTGEQSRDFIHVSDIVDGLIAMSQSNWNGLIFNLGSGQKHSIISLAEAFEPVGYQFIDRPKGEDEVTLADISFTQETLGWNPKINIKDYIRKFIEELNI